MRPAGMVAIKSVLPSGADVEAMFAEIERVAAWFHQQETLGGWKQQRAQLQRRIKKIDDLVADLDDEPYVAAVLMRLRERTEKPLSLYPEIARFHSRRDARFKFLYWELLRIWVAHGGSLSISRFTGTGGPCARYLIVTVREITGKTLEISAVQEIVKDRYYPNR
jgi:hypothetical protein